MSYFKLYPEIREDFNLTQIEWMVFCLILSFDKLTMSTPKIAKALGLGCTSVKAALKSLTEKGMITIESNTCSQGTYTVKRVVDKELYNYYIGLD